MPLLMRVFAFFLSFVLLVTANKECHVRHIGAGTDAGPAINDAFKRCARHGKVTLDDFYTVDTLLYTADLHDVEIELSGTIAFTPNIENWNNQSYFLEYQNASTFWFLSGHGIKMHGGGTIDGNGQVWWDALNSTGDSGTAGGSSRTLARPIPLTVGNSSWVEIEDIHFVGSPFWNNFVYESNHVKYKKIKIDTVSYSDAPAANSDGWDIYRSSDVVIEHSWVNNDDDCVSFKPNSTNIHVSKLWCNGSHGISVGSLGQYAGETDIVSNVFVHKISMNNAQNGARIKAFGGSSDPSSTSGGGSGVVTNITFVDFEIHNVDNPIVINQCYNTPESVCSQFPSLVTISDVKFVNFSGTSSGIDGDVVVDIQCSSQCANITATDIDLSPPNNGTATYICQNVDISQLDFNCTAPAS